MQRTATHDCQYAFDDFRRQLRAPALGRSQRWLVYTVILSVRCAFRGLGARADKTLALRLPFESGEFEHPPGHRKGLHADVLDRKSTRLNSSHPSISYAVFC